MSIIGLRRAQPGRAGPAQPNKPRLPAGPENAEAYVALAFSTLSIGCTLEKLCQDLGDIQWEIVSPTPSNSGTNIVFCTKVGNYIWKVK